MRLILLPTLERHDERVVLSFRERRVEVVVAAPFAVARGAEQPAALQVERVGGHDGGDGVEKRQRAGIESVGDVRGERLGRERARGDDAGGGKLGHFAPLDDDARVSGDTRRHRLREHDAVHRERRPARHPRLIGGVQHQARQPPHLGLEQAVGVAELDRFEGVGADELGEAVSLVRGRHADRAHLVQRDRDAPLGERPGGLAPGEPATDDDGPQVATDSAGAASSTISSCPHFRHLRDTPFALVCFSSMPRKPQLGQATGTGRFHVE